MHENLQSSSEAVKHCLEKKVNPILTSFPDLHVPLTPQTRNTLLGDARLQVHVDRQFLIAAAEHDGDAIARLMLGKQF
jgi:hypothetical protein